MAEIYIVSAADENFKEMVKMTELSSNLLRYKTFIYDLGNLGYGTPFEARISQKAGAKIPSKPLIIQDALQKVNVNDMVLWLDADAIIWDRVDEVYSNNFDIAVTVRKKKDKENSLPINAGVVFVKKTSNTDILMDKWITACNTGISDQVELNRLLNVVSNDIGNVVVRNNLRIKVLPCDIYNNFYFKKNQNHAKIIHYKSKHRAYWPRKTVNKIPKNPTKEQILLNTVGLTGDKFV